MALLAQWVAWQVIMAIPPFGNNAAAAKRKWSRFSEYCREQRAPFLKPDEGPKK